MNIVKMIGKSGKLELQLTSMTFNPTTLHLWSDGLFLLLSLRQLSKQVTSLIQAEKYTYITGT